MTSAPPHFRKQFALSYLAKVLIIPTLILAITGLAISFAYRGSWLSDLAMDLGVTAIGFIVAVTYVDVVVRKQDSNEWELVRERARDSAMSNSIRVITPYRVTLGIDGPNLDITNKTLRITTIPIFVEMVEDLIEPAIEDPRIILDQKQWATIANNLRLSHPDIDRTLALFGNRLEPSEQALLLDLQQQVLSVLSSLQAFPDVIGVPVDPRASEKQRSTHQMINTGVRRDSKKLLRIAKDAVELFGCP